MRRVALSALLSHWRRHPLQLVSLLVGLALATALWTGVQAINAEARASYDRAAGLLGQDRFDRFVPVDGQNFSQDTYVVLRRAGWQVSPVLEGRLRIDGKSLRVLGVDPVTAPQGMAPDAMRTAGDWLDFMRPPGVALAAPQTVLAWQGRDGLPRLVASDAVLPGVLVMDVGIAQSLLNADGQLSWLAIAPAQPTALADVSAIAPEMERQAAGGGVDIAALTDSFHLNLTAFGLLSFVVGLFIVHGAIGLAFEQRRPMFRTLRALGVPLRALMGVLLAEVIILALVAGVVGVLLGYIIAAALLPDVAATLRGLYGASLTEGLSLRPAWWAGGVAIAVLGATIAALQSLARLVHMPLLAPAQPRAWARMSAAGLRWQLGAAAVLLILAVGAGIWGQGVVVGFVLMGAILVSAALALPAVLAAGLWGAERLAGGVVAQWFWADTRQQLPGLSLALMALLLALAANVGVGSMVSSFRQTFVGWLDQRLVAELYVTARDEAEGVQLRAFLKDRSDAVLPIWSIESRAAGQPVFVYGVADHATYRDHWPLLQADETAWDRLADGSAVLINEQLARRAKLWPGDVLTLAGKPPLAIAGVYSDYGNPTGQVMMGQAQFIEEYPSAPRLRHGVRVAPDRASALAADLRARFDLPRDNLRAQAGVKAMSRAVFERTFTVTAALNVLTLGVAGFAILTSLLTLSSMRLPQLAPVWALGMTRGRLAWLDLLRTLVLAGVTFLLAVPLGQLLAWVLLAVVNVAAFGWRLPMYVFPGEWLRLGVMALLAAMLAAAWPVRRLARISPTELLKVFAHER